MSEQGPRPGQQGDGDYQPIFLLPSVITALIGLMAAIHIAATLVLKNEGYTQLIIWLAFWPQRLLILDQPLEAVPLLWTPFSYAFLHASWEHLILNVAWLAIFGTPVARRYGAIPTLIIFFAASLAGAVLFAATTLWTGGFLIGASGGIAGLTGAAVRFMFQPEIIAVEPETGRRLHLGRKLATLRELAQEPRARTFTIFWLVINAAVPLLPLLTGTDLQIAWQAHLGGFICGLLLVGLFDRQAQRV